MSGKIILLIMKIILLIMKTILRIVKIILLIVGLETGYAERSRKAPSRHKRYMCTNLFLDKSQPVISDGFVVQTIHSQPT